MSPHDRRIVHVTLADHPDVTTESEGEGVFRRVVIFPKKSARSDRRLARVAASRAAGEGLFAERQSRTASATRSSSSRASGGRCGRMPSGRWPVTAAIERDVAVFVRAELGLGSVEDAAGDWQPAAGRLGEGQGDVIDRAERHPADDQERQADARGQGRRSSRRQRRGRADRRRLRPARKSPRARQGVGAVGERDDIDAHAGRGRGQGGRRRAAEARGRRPRPARCGGAAARQRRRASAGSGSQPVSTGLNGIGIRPRRRARRSRPAATSVLPTPVSRAGDEADPARALTRGPRRVRRRSWSGRRARARRTG